MIDTITILIKKDKINFKKNSLTGEFILNKPSLEKETGNYYPKITGYTKKYFKDPNVKIEFSVPKIIYENNLDEVEEKDFLLVIKILKIRLEEMGLLINEKTLEEAHVSSIHYSKNIEIKNGYTTNYIISELNKINLNKTFDFTRVRYVNEGQSLYIHTSSHEFTIYDKISDIIKSKKRAIDKDKTNKENSIYKKIQSKKLRPEILRLEVRLIKRNKLKDVFKKIGIQNKLNFKEVFNEKISNLVIAYYWENLIKRKNSIIFSIEKEPKDILIDISKKYPKSKANRLIYLTGLITLSKNQKGIRELRSIIENNSKNRTWLRISKDIQELSTIPSLNVNRDWVREIEESLKIYKPFKMKNITNVC